jgi:hypothetical protein
VDSLALVPRRSAEVLNKTTFALLALVVVSSLGWFVSSCALLLCGQPPGLLPGSACCRGVAVSAGGGAMGM